MLRLHSRLRGMLQSRACTLGFVCGNGGGVSGRVFGGAAKEAALEETHQFTQKGVPLGSVLDINCGDVHFDVETRAGEVEDIGVQVSVNTPGAITHAFHRAVHDGDSNPTCIVRISALTKGVKGQIVATIPPRYCGVCVSTGGSIRISGAIKEAEQVSLRTSGGSLSCTSSISAKKIELSTQGGSLSASHLMAGTCSITAGGGAISISGRAACLDLTLDAGCADIEAASLICSISRMRGNNVHVQNLNALEGRSHVDLSGSHLGIGGLDGSLSIDASNSSNGSTLDVQLNENGRDLEIQGNGGTKVLIHATPKLALELETSAPCITRMVSEQGKAYAIDSGSVVIPASSPRPEGTELAQSNACRVEVCDVAEVTVERQSWIDNFMKRFKN